MNYNLQYHIFNQDNVLQFLNEGPLQIEKPSTYFPLLEKYTKPNKKIDFQKNNYHWYHRYKIKNVFKNKESEGELYDISNRIYKGKIFDIVKRKHLTKEIFFKTSNILNPTAIVTNKYGSNNNKWEIDFMSRNSFLQDKIYSFHNSAYIESLASLLVSRLVEKNVCPHFPLIFGIYSGTAKKMHSEFTDEYLDCKDTKWFKQGVSENKWKVIKFFEDDSNYPKIESDNSSNSSSSSQSFYFEKDEHSKTSSDKSHDDDDDDDEEPSECEEEDCENDNDDHVFISSSESSSENEEEQTTSDINLELCDESEFIITNIPDDNGIEIGGGVKEQNDSNHLELDDYLNNLDEVSVEKKDKQLETVLLELYNVPVQIIAMEKHEMSMSFLLIKEMNELDDYKTNYVMSCEFPVDNVKKYAYQWLYKTKLNRFDKKWISITAQICMALISMQYHFNMVHNDLHEQNILLQPTKNTYIYYKCNNNYYRVPTFGYIVKIIDYGRATYNMNEKEIMGDVFNFNEDAGEQYTYINAPIRKTDKIVKPNPSFDLCRLACSIVDDEDIDLDEDCESKYYRLMTLWTMDDNGLSVNRHKGFDLYQRIATDVHKLVPCEIIEKYPFTLFQVQKKQVEGWYYKINE